MDITNITVPTILDPEYASISTHQGSWAAYEFIKHSKSLRHAFLENDIPKFMNIYKECLETATHLRKEMGTKKYGENIDNDILIDYYENNVPINIIHGMYENDNIIPRNELPRELCEEYYTRNYGKVSLENILKSLIGFCCLLINHNENSFVVIPLLYNSNYLLCDPVKSKVLFVNRENIMNYTKYTTKPYLYTTIVHAISWHYPLIV